MTFITDNFQMCEHSRPCRFHNNRNYYDLYVLSVKIKKRFPVREEQSYLPLNPTHTPFLVSSPMAFKFLNVLVLNIAEKLLAGH
jgi:hypothetical protein